jgi:hypothetical protein
MDILIGCRAIYVSATENKTIHGTIVKTDPQVENDWIWILGDDGKLNVCKSSFINVSEEDVLLIKEFSEERRKRLRLLKKEDVITREELLDFD